MNNKFKNYFFIIFAGFLLPVAAYAQTATTLNFTNAGVTGRTGPTQAQVTAAYDGTTLDDAVTINTQGIQEWTVPTSGMYTIEVWGAKGGTQTEYNYGARGARMKGDFYLVAGTVVHLLIGQMGQNAGGDDGAGGGGGTFVAINNGNTPLIIAGGGGGDGAELGSSEDMALGSGSSDEDLPSYWGITAPTTGYGGNCYNTNQFSAGAGGFYGNGCTTGSYDYFGYSFSNGGIGGNAYNPGTGNDGVGGFGGGSGGTSAEFGGAGGGYTGGNSGYNNNGNNDGGQGGGSYNSGANQSNESGVNNSHGKATITYWTSGFYIVGLTFAANNSYADLTLSAAAYNTNSGSGALEASDFSFTFTQNGGPASNVTLSSIKKNNNTAEGSAGALTGGETVIRMFLDVTGTAAGMEQVSIAPASSTSIYNASGTAMGTNVYTVGLLTDLYMYANIK